MTRHPLASLAIIAAACCRPRLRWLSARRSPMTASTSAWSSTTAPAAPPPPGRSAPSPRR
ncbi:MAG: hypothetical protein MZV64_72360 [Ignavibacteriales bacterium]|nr:hypothetical protein [Ignavibacteriales bacterium]